MTIDHSRNPGRDLKDLVTRRTLMRRGFTLAGAAALGGLAAACSSDSTPAGSTPAGSASAAATPQRGGTLRIGGGGGLVPADFSLGASFGRHLLTWTQFAWPLFRQSDDPNVFDPVPALAESYEVTSDGLVHECTLRAGLSFHDGSRLDADAVAESLGSCFFADHRLRDEGPYSMNLLMTAGVQPGHTVESVKAVDELTVRLTLSAPNLDIRGALLGYPIANPAVLAEPGYGTDTEALRDIGCGPFRIRRFSPSGFVELERYEDFFEEALLDLLRFELIAEDAALGLALRAGEIDVALGLSPADFEELSASPEYHEGVSVRPENNVSLWFEAPKKPELEDPRVREAIWLAMNRPAYRDAFLTSAEASTQPILFPGTRGYFPDLPEKPYDPEQARQLLDEAGVDGLQITTITPPAVGPVSSASNLMEAIAADLREVGIELEVRVADEATAAEQAPSHDVTLWNLDGEGPFIHYLIFFVGFEGGFSPPDPRSDPDVTRLLTAAAEAADLEEQEEHLRELMRLHNEEILMGIPVGLVPNLGLSASAVSDFNSRELASYHQVWVAEQSS